MLPEKRLVELMADLLGVKLAAATIARISRDCARRFRDFADVVRDHIAAAPVKHMDETGFRIGGTTRWLHVASTALLTFYRVCAKRGSLLANVAGIVIHDHWKPYYTMPGVLHALCNAHHLRELKALVEIEKEDWARKMQRLLRRACHAANLARERGAPLKPSLIALTERRYDAVLAEGMAFHEAQTPLARPVTGGRKPRGRAPRRTGHNLLLRLATRKQDTLRFLRDPTVPFTNNQAERDGGMMKLRQKISGGFRSVEGAVDFALIRSFFSTAKKQGWAIIDALTGDPHPWRNPSACPEPGRQPGQLPFVIIGHGRRKLLWFAVARHPTAEWLAQQIVEAFPWDTAPTYLVRDNDGAYGAVFTRRVRAMGIRDRPPSPRSPWQNPYAERLIGTLRRDCLDHVSSSVHDICGGFWPPYSAYYNKTRTHLSLEKDAPLGRAIQPHGAIITVSILSGLHHCYARI